MLRHQVETRYATGAPLANQGTEISCSGNEQLGGGLSPIAAVMRAARGLWPSKTAAALAELTGTSPRAAEYWLAGNTKPGSEQIARLLRSADGFAFLCALMAGAEPPWWRMFVRVMTIVGVRRRQEADRRLLAGLETGFAERKSRIARELQGALDAEADNRAALARAEAALAVSDPDFAGPLGAALSAMGGLPARAVAAADSKTKT
jgi:hypothetical protein